jgi:hypothetical protein
MEMDTRNYQQGRHVALNIPLRRRHLASDRRLLGILGENGHGQEGGAGKEESEATPFFYLLIFQSLKAHLHWRTLAGCPADMDTDVHRIASGPSDISFCF